MRSTSSPSFVDTLIVQRQRVQQGYQSRLPGRGLPDVLAEPRTSLPDVGELTILLAGPDGASIEPQGR